MKALVFLSVLLISMDSYAQNHDLSEMTEEARNEYLVKKAKEVALAFAPEWMQWEVTPQVSPKQKYFSNNQRKKKKKNVGREYYAVTFYYNDETKAKIKYDYAATVRIWADSGEVADIGAGDWVKAFLDTEFEGARHKRRTDMLDEM